jgi:O-antigen/teichoic acid export membrane protein
MLKYLRQLASESLVYGLSGTVTRFITIFLVPLYTRALTPADYGVMSLIRNSTALVAMLASLALDSAAHRFYWDTEVLTDRKSALASWAWSWLSLSTIGAVVMTLFANAFVFKIVGTSDAIRPFRLAAWTLPFSVLSVVYLNRLRMQRKPWAFSIFALITSMISVVSAVLFVLILRWGVEGVFLAQLITATGVSLLMIAVMWDWLHPKYFDWKKLKDMLRYSIPILPAIVAFWVIDVIDRYFLRLYTTTAEVGVYEIGYSIAAVVALGTTAFQQAWIPFAMSIQHLPNARQIYAQTLVAYTWVGCFVCVGATLFAPEALRLLTTTAYYSASTVVACLAFSYFMMGAAYILSLGATIRKQTTSIGLAVGIGAILNIALNFWLVPRYGKDGAALATMLSYTVVPIFLYYRSQQIYEIPYRFGRTFAILLFAVIVIRVGGLWGIENWRFALFIKSSLMFLFLPLLFALRIVTMDHLRTVIGRPVGWPFKAAAALRR